MDCADFGGTYLLEPSIDRCFRISGIAGPGQLLLSKNFRDRLDGEINDSGKLEKISLKKDSLKGFPDEEEVYYLVPPEEQIDYILDENNVELVENAKTMSNKTKIRLLRIKKKELEGKKAEN